FFFQAEDGIRDFHVTGVQTCALPICLFRTIRPRICYAELRDLFRNLVYASDVRTIVLTGAGGNFSSGGDVFEIIEPLTHMTMPDLLAFTRMTGDVVKAMRKCPQQIVAAIDGICAGAGAILAMASDLRIATPEAKTAFLFTRVGLAGADM